MHAPSQVDGSINTRLRIRYTQLRSANAQTTELHHGGTRKKIPRVALRVFRPLAYLLRRPTVDKHERRVEYGHMCSPRQVCSLAKSTRGIIMRDASLRHITPRYFLFNPSALLSRVPLCVAFSKIFPNLDNMILV